MRIKVKGKNMDVTDALKDYAEKKISRIEKHFDIIKEAEVTESVQRNQQKVEVMLLGDGFIMRAEETTGDMYASIDQVIDKLEKQIEKYKSKVIDKPREEATRFTHSELPTAGLLADEVMVMEPKEEFVNMQTGQIVRTKTFAIKPMSPIEAASQMELLNHSFFMFRNAQTEDINVIYKRKDGNYGLIEPER